MRRSSKYFPVLRLYHIVVLYNKWSPQQCLLCGTHSDLDSALPDRKHGYSDTVAVIVRDRMVETPDTVIAALFIYWEVLFNSHDFLN